MTNLADPRFIIASGLILITALLDAIVILIVVHGPMAPNAYAIIGGILGVWHIGFAAGWGFWIGSSASSKEKDLTIQSLSQK